MSISPAEAARAVAEYGAKSKAARALGVGWNVIDRAYRKYESDNTPRIVANDLPEDDIPIEDIIGNMSTRFTKRLQHQKAKESREFHVPGTGPYAVVWFGDPHLDDDGCNWPKLQADIDEIKKRQNVYGASIGDVTNNWVGRLTRLYANQETSSKTAYKLAKWFMLDAGIPWLIWILGNHDTWNDGELVLREMSGNKIVMEDWMQMITMVRDGKRFTTMAAHNFKGHSEINTSHGARKYALRSKPADLYVQGHLHHYEMLHGTNPEKEHMFWIARMAGYKTLDSYSRNLGHGAQTEGESIVAIFHTDPATPSERVQCYGNVEYGLRMFDKVRSDWEAKQSRGKKK